MSNFGESRIPIRVFVKVFVTVVMLCTLIWWGVWTVGVNKGAHAADMDTVVARVNGEKITRADLELFLRMVWDSEVPEEIWEGAEYQRFLESFVRLRAIAQAARAEGFADDPEVQQRWEFLRVEALSEHFLQTVARARVTPQLVAEAYAQYASANPPQEEVRARHILVADEATATALIGELGLGMDFAELARKHSQDGAAAQGGDLGYFGRGRMVAPFEQAAFSLEPGNYTLNPVQTQFGWHVIYVEDRRESVTPALEEVEGQLVTELLRQQVSEVVREVVEGSRVELFDVQGNALQGNAVP